MNTSHATWARRRGATMIEIALVMPMLLFLTMALVQYGVILDTTNTLTNLSRDGARFAAIHALEGTPDQSDAAVRDHIRQSAGATIIAPVTLPDSKITITATSRASGEQVQVSIAYSLKDKMFLPSSFFGIQIFNGTYTASSVALIEGVS